MSVIESIMFNNGLESTGNYTFPQCFALSSVTIGSSVQSIGDGAFTFCAALESITIPESVTSIGNQAFSGCDSLTSVTFNGTIASSNFDSTHTFPGDLRDKYLAGGIGTYTRTSGSSDTWTMQEP